MKEVTVCLFETEWTQSEIDAGEIDADKCDQSPKIVQLEVRELIKELLTGWHASQNQLHKCSDFTRVFFSRTEENFQNGNLIEESIHLKPRATQREKRLWTWAIKAALKRGLR